MGGGGVGGRLGCIMAFMFYRVNFSEDNFLSNDGLSNGFRWPQMEDLNSSFTKYEHHCKTTCLWNIYRPFCRLVCNFKKSNHRMLYRYVRYILVFCRWHGLYSDSFKIGFSITLEKQNIITDIYSHTRNKKNILQNKGTPLVSESNFQKKSIHVAPAK